MTETDNKEVETTKPTEEKVENTAPTNKKVEKEEVTEDVKEQRREGYAQRKLKEIETEYLQTKQELADLKRSLAIEKALREHGLSEDDIELIGADTEEKIMAKAEKLAAKYKALGAEKEKEVTEKVTATFSPRYKKIDVEGATVQEKMSKLVEKL